MKISYNDYLELPASLPTAATALHNPELWAGAIGAELHGTLWRHGGELYTLHMPTSVDDEQRLRWRAEPATGIGPRMELSLRLRDAVISTHVELRVTVELSGLPWPGRGATTRRALRRATRAAAARLTALLRDKAVASPAAKAAVGAAAEGGAALDVGAAAEGGAALDDDTSDDAAFTLRDATPAQARLVEQLQRRYPRTIEQFTAMGALDHLERVARLEDGWERILHGAFDHGVHQVVDTRPTALDFDLIYAGGGLGLLHAAVMAARHGRRVMVFDRSEVGCAHREWNISREELHALVGTGVVSWDELDEVVMREYRDGLVRFFNRPDSDVAAMDLWMPEVLNVALDAGALLRLMRRKLEAAGGTVLSGRAFRTARVTSHGPMAVEVELEQLLGGATEHYSARLLLDGMGSTSPLALLRHAGNPFAGVCPTVGTVADGIAQGDAPDEYDPSLGDILVSVADAQRGEQLMWEGFPGRDNELTVYLFYYATIETAGNGASAGGLRPEGPRYSLFELFEQYFQLLPSYKRPGPAFQHVKPVYGYIPARHSLRREEAPLLRGVLAVGDSAAQQSPLTFCGFGSHVRNLGRTTTLLDYALRNELLEPAQLARINPFQTNVSLNWVFSRFMHPWDKANDVNRLQNLFLESLNDMGPERATRLFRDRMRWSDYHPMLLGVLRRWPQILPASLQVLGVRGVMQWASDYVRFSATAVAATAARLGGASGEAWLTAFSAARSPVLGLRVRAHYAEWRAMGWL